MSTLTYAMTDSATMLRFAAGLLVLGIAITLVGLDLEVLAVAASGTLVAGIGFGAAALGCFGTLAQAAAPAERGQVMALAYVVSYLAFSLPAVAAGFAATEVGLRSTALIYGAAILVISLVALVGAQLQRTRGRALTA